MKPTFSWRQLLLVCLLCAGLSSAPAAEPERPNIILMMADDLGWGDVGFNGNRIIQTPHLDAMAAAGLKFNRFYAAAPVCSPTRGSAITGRHPYRYGIFFANVGHLLPEELTLAELLGKHGYRTGHFGKWHLGTLTKSVRDANRGRPGNQHFSPPWQNGFEVCFSTESKVPTWDPLIKPRGAKDGGPWWAPVTDRAQAESYGTAFWNERGEAVTGNLEGDASRAVMDRALPFIRAAAREQQPFFAVVWFHAPHLPVVAGPKHTARYSQQPAYEQHYYGCITAMDEQVGRLREELRTLGVAENTMLWFCSDNGPEGQAGKAPGSAGPFRGRKRSLFEGGVRVPALLEWPARVQSGRTTDFPAVTSDYLPTILDVLGLEMADARPVDGISLLGLLADEMKSRPRPIAFESGNVAALSDNRYKLLIPAKEAAPEGDLLFDLLADPAEEKNLAAAHPEIIATMKKQLQEWRKSCQQSLAGGQ